MRGLRISIVLLALFLDQLSKIAVTRGMEPGESLRIVGDVIRLTYILNPGAVFGLKFGGASFHFILSLLALVLVATLLKKTKVEERLAQIGLSMVLGGALGNMIDRFRLGEVIDFLDVGFGSYRWYVFNIADSFVTVGVFLLIAEYFFQTPFSQIFKGLGLKVWGTATRNPDPDQRQ